MTVFETYRLSFYEECTGVLNKLHVENGLLNALIGKISLALPPEMEEKLRPHIGERISVLRTDIPSKPYLFREIPDRGLNDQGIALDRSSDYGFQGGD